MSVKKVSLVYISCTHSVLQEFQNIQHLPFVLGYTNCNELVDFSSLKDAGHQLTSVEATMKKR